MSKDIQAETLSLDAARLCALLARILCRGILEQDPRVLALFSSSAPSPQKKEVTDGTAA